MGLRGCSNGKFRCVVGRRGVLCTLDEEQASFASRPAVVGKGIEHPRCGIVLMLIFGEGLNLSRFTARDVVMFVFFPVGVCLGMPVAWQWEGLGGGITVASLAAFYLVDRLWSSVFPRGFAFLVLASPGFLFILCWLWARSAPQQH